MGCNVLTARSMKLTRDGKTVKTFGWIKKKNMICMYVSKLNFPKFIFTYKVLHRVCAFDWPLPVTTENTRRLLAGRVSVFRSPTSKSGRLVTRLARIIRIVAARDGSAMWRDPSLVTRRLHLDVGLWKTLRGPPCNRLVFSVSVGYRSIRGAHARATHGRHSLSDRSHRSMSA